MVEIASRQTRLEDIIKARENVRKKQKQPKSFAEGNTEGHPARY